MGGCIEDTKSTIRTVMEAQSKEVLCLSKWLHEDAELGYSEFGAAQRIANLLASKGFAVDLGIAKMPSAFRAEYRGGPGPTVVLLAELDAMPDPAGRRYAASHHSCGHNIMAAASYGAAIGLASLGDTLSGRVVLLGSPAEEARFRSGGKALLVSHGHLHGASAAMQIHPETRSRSPETYLRRPYWPAWSTIQLLFSWAGLQPLAWSWVNRHPFKMVVDDLCSPILDVSVVSAYSPPQGSEWSIADKTTLKLVLRIKGERARDLLRIENEVLARAQAMAARLDMCVESDLHRNRYYNMVQNLTLGELFATNYQSLGESIIDEAPVDDEHPIVESAGDMGNVSHVVPSLHPHIVMESCAPIHSDEFARATGSSDGDRAVKLGALGMALTCVDVLNNREDRMKAMEEFLHADIT